MPTVSKSQERTMRAAAHDPAFAKKVGIKQSVAKEFVEADKNAPKKNKPEHKKKPSNESVSSIHVGKFRDQ